MNTKTHRFIKHFINSNVDSKFLNKSEILAYDRIPASSWKSRREIFEFVALSMSVASPNGDRNHDAILKEYNNNSYFAAKCLLEAAEYLWNELKEIAIWETRATNSFGRKQF
ncbi:hypothetical protein [Ferrovum sp.]|uniref:hypothetical protein n=1 Tax=Ferrovum sp. TaxID=2609467 RepID=UPI00260C72F5|nr:hypothetical protein [Ferrovum sp.]